jgi:hypothetical protein
MMRTRRCLEKCSSQIARCSVLDIGIPVTSISYSYAGEPSQNIELSARREEVQIRFRRTNADVLLIKALGGGW